MIYVHRNNIKVKVGSNLCKCCLFKTVFSLICYIMIFLFVCYGDFMTSGLTDYFNLFTREKCELETYKALALRVGIALEEVFKLNPSFEELNIYAVKKDGDSHWLNLTLKVENEASLLLDDLKWDLVVKSWNTYKVLEKDEKKKLIDNIQNVIDLAMSFFPTYKPLGEQASFTLNRKGFLLKTGIEDQIVGSYKI